MSEIHNTNASPVTPAPESWIADSIKKSLVPIIFSLVSGLFVYFLTSHDSGRDLKYQVETNTKAIEKLQQADKEQSETLNQFLIGITKISEAQTRMAQDIQKIQDQQVRNTEMLINRK